MQLQIIKDGYGNNTGIFVPINDWNTITQKHQDLKALVLVETTPQRKKLSELAGTLSSQTAEYLLKHIEEGRAEWEERI